MSVERLAGLIVLDVDGTIWALPDRSKHRFERTGVAGVEPSISPEIVTELDRMASYAGVRVAWLTSWSEDELRDFIDQRLVGRLAGAYVPHVNRYEPNWRAHSLRSFLEREDIDRVVWADDSDDDIVEGESLFAGTALLRVRPDPRIGLEGAHLGQMRAHLLLDQNDE